MANLKRVCSAILAISAGNWFHSLTILLVKNLLLVAETTDDCPTNLY